MAGWSWKTVFWIVISGAPAAWILLHLSHYHCRQLFLDYGFGNRSGERAAKFVHLWRVLQFVERILLLVCYGLVFYSLIVAHTDEACFILATAVILAGACPDQWRKCGTISYSYFEVLVIVACCAATYYTGVLSLKVLGLGNGLLVCSTGVIVAIHNALVVRARRTHMPLTFTASIGVLSQLLAPRRKLDDRLDHGFEHFHAICNINKVERDLERVGTGVALALYDFIAHMLAGSLVIAVAWVSLHIVAASSLDVDGPFRYSLFVWIAYGSLTCAQGVAVGCVYVYYSRIFRRSNPFTKEEAEVFSRWWCGGVLAFISQRAGHWRQTRALIPNSNAALALVPLMANPAQSAIGLLSSVQPGIDLLVGWAGAVLCRVAPKFPVPTYVVDSDTRTEAVTAWAVKDFELPDQVRTTAMILQNFTMLMNCDSDCVGVYYPLLKVTGEFVPTVGRWCTYILLCAGMRQGFTAPLMDVLIDALRHHNEEEYKIEFVLGEDTVEQFEIFGKKGMLRRALTYIMFAAGLSVSWDVPAESLTRFTLVQSTLTVVDAHNDFPSLGGLMSSLEKDVSLVFGSERAITNDTISTADMFLGMVDPSCFEIPKAHSE